jgi:S1-C subfamily serine protease
LGVAVDTAPGGGVRVTQVMEDTAAKSAGLQAGDVILELNGSPISDHQALVVGIREAGQGTQVTLKVRRGGSEFIQAVRLGAPPKQ